MVGKGLVIGEPKSEKSKRATPLPSFAIEAVKRQLEYHAAIDEPMNNTTNIVRTKWKKTTTKNSN